MGLLDDAAPQSQNCMYRTWFWSYSLWDTGMLATPRRCKTWKPRSQISLAVGSHSPSRGAGCIGLIGSFQEHWNRGTVCTLASSVVWQGCVCRTQRLVLRNWLSVLFAFQGFFFFFYWTNSRLAAWTQCLFVLKCAGCAPGFTSYSSILYKRNQVHPLQDGFVICRQWVQ